MSSKKRDNIIIYGSLIAAIACLIYASFDYYKDFSDSIKVKDEIKEAFKEMAIEGESKEIKAPEEEPPELANIDKQAIINERLKDIKNRKSVDDLLDYNMIRSWGEYEITDINYQKEVTDNYYMYLINIKIPNKEASLPVNINEELSTEEYNVITIKTFIIKNNNGYAFKHFEK